ncbi:MAG: pellicle/biofilm biosynthesis Wzx-like polysaccharide transporter PelG [Minwuia thermotolerans]|nr:MAG: pellicle/biofilm biosynthesis Wzx-like polysaccharide transporter PelG [Minwuia thermotolerans]
MAGIGFALRRLTDRDDLLGIVQGYAHSTIVSSGPWLFTILAVGSINLFGIYFTDLEELISFRIVLIYNFAFSLAFSGPILLVATRYLADMIFKKAVIEAPGMLIAALFMLLGTQAFIVVPFYVFVVDVPPLIIAGALMNYFLVTAIWMVNVFLTALKDYRSITLAFFVGMMSGGAMGLFLAADFGAFGILIGFNFGLGLIFFALVARVFAEYPYRITRPFAFLAYFRKYWDLALAGLIYNLAIWVDKWVMWCAPEREVLESGFVSYPIYDGAMFLAYLTIVPAMAVFIVNIETRFFEHYQRFYRDIEHHANYERIEENHQNLIDALLAASRNVIVLQFCLCVTAILVAGPLFEAVGIPALQLGIFRFGVLGALFHVLLMFVGIVLAYFDLRKVMLGVQVLYLLTNGLFTWVTMELGFPYYGYGYFMASLLTFLIAYGVCAWHVGRLPFLTFVRNNASV